jgi:hypothetical protein
MAVTETGASERILAGRNAEHPQSFQIRNLGFQILDFGFSTHPAGDRGGRVEI